MIADAEQAELAQVVRDTAGRGDVVAAVNDIYARLAGEVAVVAPRCDASGKCCHFEAYGHRLYVTTLELTAFVAAGHEHAADDHDGAAADQSVPGTFALVVLPAAIGGCPFQIEGLCGAHARRPFGCRVFYCDPAAEAWQVDAYERYHAELKRLHERFDVPYRYLEWRAALTAIDAN